MNSLLMFEIQPIIIRYLELGNPDMWEFQGGSSSLSVILGVSVFIYNKIVLKKYVAQ